MIRALRRFKDPMAAPPYLSLLKLREAPFAPSAGVKFFYSDPERAQTLNMLQHLTQYSEELLLVSGPEGAGKSSLLEQYLSRADDDWKVCNVNAGAMADPAALFLAVARCFGLITDGISSDQLLGALQEHLNHLQQSMMPVLAVDDAQRLTEDALEIVVRLADLPGEHGRLVRVILFADASILQRFKSPRFASAPHPHVLELKPLDETQTISYLQHRLVTAGYGGGPLFQPKDVKRIHKQSEGWPGGINAIAHEVLMSKRKVSAVSPMKLLALLVLAAGAGLAGYMILSGHVNGAENAHPASSVPATPAPVKQLTVERPIVRATEQPKTAQTALVVRSGETLQITCAAPSNAGAVPATATLPLLQEQHPGVAAALPEHTPPAAAGQEHGGTRTPVHEQPTAEPAPASVTGETAPMPDAPAPAATSLTTAATEPEQGAEQPRVTEQAPVAELTWVPVIESIEPNPVSATGERTVVNVRGKYFVANSEVTISGKGRRKTIPAGQVHVTDPEHATIEFNPGMSAATLSLTISSGAGTSEPFQFHVVEATKAEPAPAPHAQTSTPAPTTVPPTPPVATQPAAQPPLAGFKDAAWLWAQDPKRFTVQLVGATSEQAIQAHLHGYNVSGDIVLMQTWRGGKPWYVVFWGDFASREEAQQVVATLPADLRKTGPWIRPFADVHKDAAQAAPAKR